MRRQTLNRIITVSASLVTIPTIVIGRNSEPLPSRESSGRHITTSPYPITCVEARRKAPQSIHSLPAVFSTVLCEDGSDLSKVESSSAKLVDGNDPARAQTSGEQAVVEEDEDDTEWEKSKMHCILCRCAILSPCKPLFKVWSKCYDRKLAKDDAEAKAASNAKETGSESATAEDGEKKSATGDGGNTDKAVDECYRDFIPFIECARVHEQHFKTCLGEDDDDDEGKDKSAGGDDKGTETAPPPSDATLPTITEGDRDLDKEKKSS
jgi:hypothetical protein